MVAPNSPDLAYPIEDIWGIIKPRVKRRNPKNLNELKQFLLEEWNSIPLEMVQNLCEGYLKRVEMVYNMNGKRLEKEHLKKLKKKEIHYEWTKPENLPNKRVIYNNKVLKLLQKREIDLLKKNIKEVKKNLTGQIKDLSKRAKSLPKKKDLKYMSLGLGISFANAIEKTKEKKLQKKEEKEKAITEWEGKIKKVSAMNIFEYLKHLKEEDKIVGDEDSISTKDNESENKMENLENLINNYKEIHYEIKLRKKKKNII